MDILSKVLNYEETIFKEYIYKRNKLIQHIKSIQTLNDAQLLIFVNDMKEIIDPIKTSISGINFYFTNTDFKNNKNVIENQELITLYYLFLVLRLNLVSDVSELTLETERSEPDSDSVSESSESDVSESEL